jgi:hypothetical protein
MYVNILGYCVTVQLNSCSLLLVVFPTKRRFVGEMESKREWKNSNLARSVIPTRSTSAFWDYVWWSFLSLYKSI